jgi:hypothetical protein
MSSAKKALLAAVTVSFVSSCASARSASENDAGTDASIGDDGGSDRDAALDAQQSRRTDGGDSGSEAGSPDAEEQMCTKQWPQSDPSRCGVQDPSEALRCGEPAFVFDGVRCVPATGQGCDELRRADYGSLAECARNCAEQGYCHEELFEYIGPGQGDEPQEVEVGDVCEELHGCSFGQRPCPLPDEWRPSSEEGCFFYDRPQGENIVDEDLYTQMCAFSLMPSVEEVVCQLNAGGL